jgi:hypothetical protein
MGLERGEDEGYIGKRLAGFPGQQNERWGISPLPEEVVFFPLRRTFFAPTYRNYSLLLKGEIT